MSSSSGSRLPRRTTRFRRRPTSRARPRASCPSVARARARASRSCSRSCSRWSAGAVLALSPGARSGVADLVDRDPGHPHRAAGLASPDPLQRPALLRHGDRPRRSARALRPAASLPGASRRARPRVRARRPAGGDDHRDLRRRRAPCGARLQPVEDGRPHALLQGARRQLGGRVHERRIGSRGLDPRVRPRRLVLRAGSAGGVARRDGAPRATSRGTCSRGASATSSSGWRPT